MRRTPLRAVLFDRDGTLCDYDPSLDGEFCAWVQANSRYNPVPFAEAQRIVWDEFFASHRSDMIVDLGVEARFWIAFWQRSLSLLGVNADRLQEALDRFIFYRFFRLYPEVKKVLTALRERGLCLGVISNTLPSLCDSLAYLGIAQFFQAIICSASVGVAKPVAEIYRRALSVLDVAAYESLFVDDEYENVVGAMAVGMDALWLDRSRKAHALSEHIIADLEGVLAYLGWGIT